MKLSIKKVKQEHFNSVYELLKQEDFPYLPVDKQTAFNELKQSDNFIYAGFVEDNLVLFLCFSIRNHKLYFDIACSKKYQRKWANKKILKFIFETAFIDLNFQEFYVESFTHQARNVVEKFGFKKVDSCFYVLNKNSKVVNKYLQIEDKINETTIKK